jgi:hypothetical protein
MKETGSSKAKCCPYDHPKKPEGEEQVLCGDFGRHAPVRDFLRRIDCGALYYHILAVHFRLGHSSTGLAVN